MGIYDRDYYREDSRWNHPFARAKGTVFLCLYYIVFFVVQVATLDPVQRWIRPQVTGVTEFMQLDADKVFQGEVWRLITYGFVHDPRAGLPIALVLTIIFLAWIGHQLEDIYGIKEFLAFYVVATLLGGVAYTLLALTGQPLHPLMGPSGAITGLLIL